MNVFKYYTGGSIKKMTFKCLFYLILIMFLIVFIQTNPQYVIYITCVIIGYFLFVKYKKHLKIKGNSSDGTDKWLPLMLLAMNLKNAESNFSKRDNTITLPDRSHDNLEKRILQALRENNNGPKKRKKKFKDFE